MKNNKIYHQEYYLKNKNRLNKQHKEYREKNRDKINKLNRDYYKNNKIKCKKRRKCWSKRYFQINKDFIFDYRKDRCCSYCGWKEHPEILQFHHANGIKNASIACFNLAL
jgi:hypothetical protein